MKPFEIKLLENEEFKPIEGFEDYLVSNMGRVYSRFYHKFLKHGMREDGTPIVSLRANGIKHTKRLHRLVAETFLGKQKDDLQIMHLNGNKADNRVVNLQWCTKGENLKHAWDTGLRKMSPEYSKNIAKGHYKKVIRLDTLEVYESVQQASLLTKTNKCSISSCVSGKQMRAGGIEWMLLSDYNKEQADHFDDLDRLTGESKCGKK